MKKMILSLLIVILTNILLVAQTEILDDYPPTQHFYQKGELNFLKDLQKVALENDLKPCENPEEHYQPKWIVKQDSTIVFIKDMDTINIQKNKCAFDFTKNVFKYLEGWNPVFYNQKTYAAIATYDINPSDIFKLQINDDLKPNFTRAEYRGGDTAFRIGVERLINPIFDRNHLTLNNQDITIRFKVSKLGMVKEIKIYPQIPFRIEDEILAAVQQDLKKWKPAMLNGIAVEQQFQINLHFE